MNEAILKWLASGTIGLVVCGSLWLAGSVQHEVNAVGMASAAGKAMHVRTLNADNHSTSRPIDPPAPTVVARTSVSVD